MNIYRAVMITGPPGIGKTTSAHLCAKIAGFTPVEVNASDSRSKKLVEVRFSFSGLVCNTSVLMRGCCVVQSGINMDNTSLDGWMGQGEVSSFVKSLSDVQLIVVSLITLRPQMRRGCQSATRRV